MATETVQGALNNFNLNQAGLLNSLSLGSFLNALCATGSQGVNWESPAVTSHVSTLVNGTIATGTVPLVIALAGSGTLGVLAAAAGAPSAGQFEVTGSGASVTTNSGDAWTALLIAYVPAGGALATAYAALQATSSI